MRAIISPATIEHRFRVLLPKDDRKPGGEVFLILETTFVHRGTGRFNGQAVEGSRSTEYSWRRDFNTPHGPAS